MKLQTLSVIGIAASSVTLAANKAQVDLNKKINVIYILADDLGFGDLGCTGQTKFSTPNIDRLRAEGMLLTQHYSGSTVSAPSRSALLTGQHTGHTYIRGNKEIKGSDGQEPLPAGTYTLARLFKDANYATACAGKWGLGFPGSSGDPVNQGFDDFFGYNCQRQAHRYYPTYLWHNSEKVALEGNTNYQREQYAPDLIHEHTLEWISKNKDNPFFIFYALVQPHAELIVPQDPIIDSYKGKFDEQPYKAGKGGDYGPYMTPEGYCSQEYPNATFAAMVARVDKYVGELLDLLKAEELDRNTIVLFTSDNGPHREGGANPDYFDSYGPYRGVKRDLYEGGIHLPLIAWAPKYIQKGSSSSHVCAMWDMLPTFSEIAIVEMPANLQTDGISIAPTLFDRGVQDQHSYLYWEFHEFGGKQAVRMGNWKGIMLNVFDPKKSSFELYDLSCDQGEQNNIESQHPDISNKIKEIMRTARTKSKIFLFNNPSVYI